MKSYELNVCIRDCRLEKFATIGLFCPWLIIVFGLCKTIDQFSKSNNDNEQVRTFIFIWILSFEVTRTYTMILSYLNHSMISLWTARRLSTTAPRRSYSEDMSITKHLMRQWLDTYWDAVLSNCPIKASLSCDVTVLLPHINYGFIYAKLYIQMYI